MMVSCITKALICPNNKVSTKFKRHDRLIYRKNYTIINPNQLETSNEFPHTKPGYFF